MLNRLITSVFFSYYIFHDTDGNLGNVVFQIFGIPILLRTKYDGDKVTSGNLSLYMFYTHSESAPMTTYPLLKFILGNPVERDVRTKKKPVVFRLGSTDYTISEYKHFTVYKNIGVLYKFDKTKAYLVTSPMNDCADFTINFRGDKLSRKPEPHEIVRRSIQVKDIMREVTVS